MGGPETPTSLRRLVLICTALFALYVVIAACTQLFDRDEPRFARCAVEMVDSGDYLIPRFNGALRPDKPVMIYWLMSVPIRALGAVETAVRLPSNLGMVVSVLCTFLIARLMFDERIARCAALMYGTCVLCMWIGTAATADGVLIAAMTAAIWPFIHRLYRGAQWWQFPLMAAALGVAQLTKGPVGLLVPAITMLGIAVALRKSPDRVPRRVYGGIALASLIGFGLFAAWGVPAVIDNPDLLREGIGRHVLQRAVQPAEGHGGSTIGLYLLTLPLYVPFIIAGFYPWMLFLPGGISALLRRHVGDPRSRAVLLGWIIPTFAFMTLVVTKLPHYVLGIYPALAILSAATLHARLDHALSENDRNWLRGGVFFVLPISATMILGLLIGPWWIDATTGVLGGVLGLVALAVTIHLVLVHFREDVRRSYLWSAFSVPLLLVAALLVIYPRAAPSIQISRAVAATIHRELDRIVQDTPNAKPVPISMTGYTEGSLVFYLDRPADEPITILGESPGAIRTWLRTRRPGILIIDARLLEPLESELEALRVRILGEHAVVNYSSHAQAGSVLVLSRWHIGQRSEPVRLPEDGNVADQ
jgi:4-amino-4-deoxy-L-arabinose transferase-like glycosyltransferase